MIYGDITNCSVVGHGQISAYQCRMGYQVISADTNTNTRQIKLQLEARTIDSRYATTGYQLTPTIDGVNVAPIGMNFSKSNVNIWQVLGTRIITIIGAFNGVKTGSFTTNINAEWGLKSGSASVTIVLEDLHMSPVITSVSLTEKNTLLNNYTGIAQFLSLKNITFETTTYDDATISSYQVQHNGVLIGSSITNVMTVDFSEVGTLATYEMDGKTWATLKFVVIDSFGTIGSVEMPFEVIKYTKPNLVKTSSSIKRNGQVTGKVKLNLVGSFFNSSINGVQNGISLKFAYWKKGGEVSETYYDIPYSPNDNKIELLNWNVAINEKEITDVDKDSAYFFAITAVDNFGKESFIMLTCPVGEYLWAEYKDRVDFKNITIQGSDYFKYSYEEIRIGTYLDKPLYRKVVDFGSLPNATVKEVPHGISNIEKVVTVRGIAGFFPIPRIHKEAVLNIGIEAGPVNVLILTNYNYSSTNAIAILEYTKTTD